MTRPFEPKSPWTLLNECEARLAAAERVVEAARDDGHTHAIEECPVCAAIRAYEKAYLSKQDWHGPRGPECDEYGCTCGKAEKEGE